MQKLFDSLRSRHPLKLVPGRRQQPSESDGRGIVRFLSKLGNPKAITVAERKLHAQDIGFVGTVRLLFDLQKRGKGKKKDQDRPEASEI
jgi:hypothetical protein